MQVIMKIASNIDELVNQYNTLNSGHFFDKDTMRFFDSKLTDSFKRINDKKVYFITTEKCIFGEAKRKATIRVAELLEYVRESDKKTCYKIRIETLGEFNKLSLYTAKKVLETLE